MATERSNKLIFFCNGKKVIEENPNPTMTLLTYLRIKLRLTGTKLGCAEGGCGACTVMLSDLDVVTFKIRHRAVNACLFPLCAAHGTAITTVEGLGNTREKLHPVQERIAKAHGTQCGFCTPGMVMSMYALLRNKPTPTMDDIITALGGNLCRCTGYRPIIEGFKTFTKGNSCCAQRGSNCCINDSNDTNNAYDMHLEENTSTKLFDPKDFLPYDPSQDPIFPPELQVSNADFHASVTFIGDNIRWLRPVRLSELLEIKSTHPDTQLLVGNTEVGIDVKFKHKHFPVLLLADSIPEMKLLKLKKDGLEVGSSITLSRLDETLKQLIRKLPEHQTRTFRALIEVIQWFAGTQIRNVASVGGNIMTGSPISDLNPVFMATECTLRLVSSTGERFVPMNPKFYPGYRKTILKDDEILQSIFIPLSTENEYIFSYKQSKRKEDDIAIVNAGMKVRIQSHTLVEDIQLAFGGMGPTTVMAEKTMQNLKRRMWDENLMEDACCYLQEDLQLVPGAPGGMEVYRMSLVFSFFFKFYLAVYDQLSRKMEKQVQLPARTRSAIEAYHPEECKGIQLYQVVPRGQPSYDGVGRPMPHQSALQHATGEAIYVDDMPHLAGELYLAFIFSQRSHAKLISLDKTAALAIMGVRYAFTSKDFPELEEPNKDEVLLAKDKVYAVGSIIGVVLADTKQLAQEGVRHVRIVYEDLEPILTVEDAIAKDSFYPPTRTMSNGNIVEGFKNCDNVIEGEMDVGGQEHFYLETQTALLIPKENDEMEIWSPCQSINNIQSMVAKTLKVSSNRITVRTKRMGGAFGGKDLKTFPAVAALASRKSNRPVRFALDRDEDMISTGGRHPMKAKYKIGFNLDGKLVAMETNLYANCGFMLGASLAVMTRSMFHCDNVYKIDNIHITGHLCKTNLPSNTAFRGFGIPQVVVVTESWMNQIAKICNLTPEQVRKKNFYQEYDRTHFDQQLDGVTIQKCWDQCVKEFDFSKRRQKVDEFNRNNRWKKQGVSINPVKMGVAIVSSASSNQAGVLLNVYEDGSVLISHSGAEMGQGLHTKIIQIASRCLHIPVTNIYISETNTEKVPCKTLTAGSISTDINGLAVKKACESIKKRLEHYIQANSKGTWEDWVRAAYKDRVSLSVIAHHKVDVDYDLETNTGRPFDYFTYGVAATVVEIDCLTGDHHVIKTHIVMDVGDSLNPAIDVGQIEGGFIQGYGLYVLEDHLITPEGHLLTKGPGTYKIPSLSNTPANFSVSLLSNVPHRRGIFSSKGIGETSLMLATSVFCAIKDAIQAARKESGLTDFFKLDSPATSERIRLACYDEFLTKIKHPVPGTYKPFSIRP